MRNLEPRTMKLFFIQWRAELHKLIARKRTFLGFGAFVLLEIVMLILVTVQGGRAGSGASSRMRGRYSKSTSPVSRSVTSCCASRFFSWVGSTFPWWRAMWWPRRARMATCVSSWHDPFRACACCRSSTPVCLPLHRGADPVHCLDGAAAGDHDARLGRRPLRLSRLSSSSSPSMTRPRACSAMRCPPSPYR